MSDQKVLTFDNYSFSYHKKSNDPTISIDYLALDRGETVLLTGPSGCGKSTLAKAAAGILQDIYPPIHMKGDIYHLDKNIKQLSLAEIALNIGIVQQDPESQFCTFTVEQEITFGLENLKFPPNKIEERLQHALQITNISHLKKRPTANLSGGEKQRVILAAMIALNPQVLILDEPTANLDPDATHDLLKLIKLLSKDHNQTIFIIEHKLKKFLPIADSLLIMEDGRITKQFNPQSTSVKSKLDDIQSIRPLTLPNSLIAHTTNKLNSELLHIRKLSFSYDTIPALRNIDLRINEGEICGIIGPNGSGKSTLLNIINGLLKPDLLTALELKEQSIQEKTAAQRAEFMSSVFQNPNLQIFERTVEQELLFTAMNLDLISEQLKETAAQLLRDLHLDQYRSRTPFALSYGEKKRLTVSSAILHEPQLILLDEPFIGQDYLNVLEIIKILTQRDYGILIVSHDTEILSKLCDRIIFLKAGEILVNAPPAAAFKKIQELGYSNYVPLRELGEKKNYV